MFDGVKLINTVAVEEMEFSRRCHDISFIMEILLFLLQWLLRACNNKVSWEKLSRYTKTILL